ncbi:MAG: hypothetical protein QOE64_2854 [Frankiales bacterium]|nr:hypothetical protein [Frankiales bacterium]
MDSRLRACCDLFHSAVREYAGRHEYDGIVADLSPDAIAHKLSRLGVGPALDDPHDESHLKAFEAMLRVQFAPASDGGVEIHRWNPLLIASELDLACYDKEYAPAEERAAARSRHLAGWPAALESALESLDRVSVPVAKAALPALRGTAGGISPDDGAAGEQALAAHARLIAHLEAAAESGPTETALGAPALAALLGSGEAVEVDLGALAARADSERDRLRALLDDACAQLKPGLSTADAVKQLVSDHPDIDGVLEQARKDTETALRFTAERGLAPYTDGECRVGPAPESRRWAMAMMSWAAPGEPEGPSWYHVTPPDPSWPAEDVEEWLAVFSRTTLPAITVHEVAPGHYAHGRALRRAPSEVRRTLFSEAFAEGWAHYVEELCLEEGYPGDGDREAELHYQAGVAIEALVRVTRFACAIGVHTGGMTVEDGARRFEQDAFLQGPAAVSEAARATFDPTYGRYTWGKLAILDLREEAKKRWGSEFSLSRFHAALLDLGSPPLGLMATALERG